MSKVSTIQLEKTVINQLKKAKEYPRQTYNELILKMAKVFKKVNKKDQYDEFLHKIQQPKMKELWDNIEDEVWEKKRGKKHKKRMFTLKPSDWGPGTERLSEQIDEILYG